MPEVELRAAICEAVVMCPSDVLAELWRLVAPYSDEGRYLASQRASCAKNTSR